MALKTAGWDLDVGCSDASEEDFKRGKKWINRSMMNWVFIYVDNCFEYKTRQEQVREHSVEFIMHLCQNSLQLIRIQIHDQDSGSRFRIHIRSGAVPVSMEALLQIPNVINIHPLLSERSPGFKIDPESRLRSQPKVHRGSNLGHAEETLCTTHAAMLVTNK